MKKIDDKYILIAADMGGFPLKEAVKGYLISKGWHVTDIGVQSADEVDSEMFQRIGFRVGAKITEGEFERAIIFCGTGMGIHIAASQCPHVQCAVVESVPAATRCVTGNNCNVLAMGAYYIAPQKGMAIADAFLSARFGQGYEHIPNFNEFHKLAYDEIDAFDYEAFKANGFEPIRLGDYKIGDAARHP
ncbi:MAG: RpiB/LacA/LacB family sugar-phosphate isomerase [Clostridia bacterium]|nr:RpiB/LacA/LacB family sugar-phosphate isomerase [Clostridia bacterium]